MRAPFKATTCSFPGEGDGGIHLPLIIRRQLNFAVCSPSATGLYCPSLPEMLFGVVPAVFLFFSAFLLDIFTEDKSDVKTGAGPVRPLVGLKR